ncbi:MAG: prephenate dehydratase [Deltaproteobacteria bacterium]|nr:prephenate dehydratase [Deltaproteobacteria bacterium]
MSRAPEDDPPEDTPATTASPPPESTHALGSVRSALDSVDRRLLEALAERVRLVERVAERKSRGGAVVRDPAREEALLGKLVDLGREAGLDAFLVTRVFREVLDHSLRVQIERLAGRAGDEATITVGFQGGEGAYSHMCAQRFFSARKAAIFRGYPDFRSMLEAVRDGALAYAVLPIENTTAGSINESYDLLAEYDLRLVGEEVQRVEHCLIGLADVPLHRIRRIYSHPVALAQCRAFLSSLPGCHAEASEDTALSVAKVKREQDLSQAAIASEEAARIYGLPILRRHVQDQRENLTRMVIVAREDEPRDPRLPCKTSLVFATKHERGALARGIAVLSEHGLNLTKLESRPRPNTPWEYRFYLDFEGDIDDPNVAEALEQLGAETSYLRVLGCYPARTLPESRPVEPAQPAAKAATPKPAPAQGVVRVGDRLEIGAVPVVFAGPASGDDPAEAAAAARDANAQGYWGAFLSEGGLIGKAREAVVRAAHERSLPIALPVDHAADVRELTRRAELLVVPPARMHDTVLLRELGHVDAAVAISRLPGSRLSEWLDAARFVRERGNGRLILVDGSSRRLPDLALLPEITAACDHPVLVSLQAASPDARPRLAEAARIAGAHGVICPSGESLAAVVAAVRGS